MKKIFITLLLHFFFVMPSFSLGSIITTRNSYFYAKPNLQSTQYYISTYNSFKVLDIFVDSRGKVFFLVEKNIIRKKKKGIGFVYVNLEDTKEDKVKFFKKIPVKKSDFLSSYQISTEDLKATGKVFSSKDVPFLNWYEVNYNVDFSEKIWAEDRKVAYRPNKSVKWLNQKYLLRVVIIEPKEKLGITKKKCKRRVINIFFILICDLLVRRYLEKISF